MRHLLIGTVVGLVLGFLLAQTVRPVEAQGPERVFGTSTTTGAAVPIGMTGNALNVVAQ